VLDGELAVQGIAQPVRIAGLAFGHATAEQWGTQKRAVDFFDVKADIEALIAPLKARFAAEDQHPALHPGRCAAVYLGDAKIGVIGELHPQWLQAYEIPAIANTAPIVFELDVAALQNLPLSAPQVPSKLPMVRRDIALVVESALPSESVLATLRAVSSEVVREITLFDVYQGAGLPEAKKSLAFQVLMQDTSATLTDEIADQAISALVAAAAQAHQAHLRT
jgi:phenylalanyl-tRNA synthetase beta chain